MKRLCFYFQVHQPYRVSDYTVFDVGSGKGYFHGPRRGANREVFDKVARKCYLPMNALLLEMLKKERGFRVAFSISGVFIEQCLEFGEIGKQVLESFRKLVATDRVELLAETYYHSLSSLYDLSEFESQVKKHVSLMKETFGVTPKVFRNTELIYSDAIASEVARMGFRGMLLEGWDDVLGWRSANYIYSSVTSGKGQGGVSDRKSEGRRRKKEDGRDRKASSLRGDPSFHSGQAMQSQSNRTKRTTVQDDPSVSLPPVAIHLPLGREGHPNMPFTLLLKNYRLSDDIAFRFGNKAWEGYPLTADKFVEWVAESEGETFNLFMDYETFGEHQWDDTGIFDFMRHLPAACRKRKIGFHTPSDALKKLRPVGTITVERPLSWADMERDLSAWTENEMQRSSLERLFALGGRILASHKKDLIERWRKLQTSDHFYYMSTKYWNDGDVHAYFSPFESPYEAYMNFTNVLTDLEREITKH